MDSGFYAACSGLVAKTRQLEIAAHNLANASTTAFKAQQVSFRSLIASASSDLTSLNQSLNEYGVSGSPSMNLSTGILEHTGNDMDVALEGRAYLVVQTGKGLAYTRNGHFEVSPNGDLRTAGGDSVLGDQGPVRIPPGTSVQFSPDGTISANGALVAKLRLVEFPDSAALLEVSPGMFLSEANPVVAKNAAVRQGTLEASNVNPVSAAVGLIAIQRHAEMLQRALSIFHSEFNRIASGELSRV